MPVTSGFSCFPHFTQRLLLTTSTYSFYFIFFYAKRERIFRKRTHGVWKRWVQICFYFLLNYKKKVVILLSYFSVTKSTKSHLRGLSSLLKNTLRVHELVAQAMRGECVRQRAERKSEVLPLSAVLTTPRVRTYHTKEPSRFVHALPARPLKVQGGREFSPCADGMKSIFFALYVGYTWTLCVGRWLAAAVET